ncbi:MAG: 3'-5' exonuclease [Candidatus Omnitrophota bacterium]|nr:3'-5' exonuclease [Candidatus Omnitrophota bacterium]MDZ4242151.1 3'-5' exonuclease [Candidatus Omnitrophota bacterium]
MTDIRDLQNQELVFFDVETTGLSPGNGDRVVEIAALKVKGLKPVARFHSLVDPRRDISWGAFAVNRITPEMLRGAPVAGEVLPEFLDFWGGACLVGHHVRFDLGFLMSELSLSGLSCPSPVHAIDTVRLARSVMPGLDRYSLVSVAYALGVADSQRHRAMEDVELTFAIFRKLLEKAAWVSSGLVVEFLGSCVEEYSVSV